MVPKKVSGPLQEHTHENWGEPTEYGENEQNVCLALAFAFETVFNCKCFFKEFFDGLHDEADR